MVVRERLMLKKLVQKGHRLLVYKRYIKDIFPIILVEAKRRKGKEAAETRIETGLNGLDPGDIIRVEGRGIVSNTKRKAGEKEKKIECLYINTELGWGGKGLRMETGIYRKEAATDMHIQGGLCTPRVVEDGNDKRRNNEICITMLFGARV